MLSGPFLNWLMVSNSFSTTNGMKILNDIRISFQIFKGLTPPASYDGQVKHIESCVKPYICMYI